MTQEHTPGPWEQSHRRSDRDGMYRTEVYTPDNGTGDGVIATLAWYPKPIDDKGTIGTYRAANARLIAAAPDLLEALEMLTAGDIDVSGTAIIYDADPASLLSSARAAIAKAKGSAA